MSAKNTTERLKATLHPYGLDCLDLLPSTSAYAIVELGVEDSLWRGVVWIYKEHSRITHLNQEVLPYRKDDLEGLVIEYVTLHLKRQAV